MLPRVQNVKFTVEQSQADTRQGSVLVTVLVVIVMLTLACYSFTEIMLAELQATDRYEREVQTRAIADSGAEYVAAILGQQGVETVPTNLYQNPAMFRDIALFDAQAARRSGRFSVVAVESYESNNGSIRFGMVDESSKLNINEILQMGLDDEQQREMLLALPSMTIEIADAILDWIDEDDEPRQYGAENEYYGTLPSPYEARNGRIESIEELLRVRDVSYSLLYGEDWNRNGLLDPWENDADQLPPIDNADGVLLLGWSAYLTIESREANVRRDGRPRINVNQDDLATLYDELRAEFDEETALFITAFRLNGPTNSSGGGNQGGGSVAGGPPSGSGAGAGSSSRRTVADASRGQTASNSPASGTGATASVDSGSASTPSGSGAGSNAATGAGQPTNSSGRRSGSTPSTGGGSGSTPSGNSTSASETTRGGIDLSSGGQRQVTSLYEFVGARVTARVDGQQKELESPWANRPADLQNALPQILDVLTTTDDAYIAGRINISQAPREVLMAIPDIDEQLVIAILGSQASAFGASMESDPLRLTSGWLLTQGLVEIEELRTLDRYITGSGDVFRAQIIGYFDEGPSATRLDALFDATQSPPQILSVRDLTPLGGGLSRNQLK